MLQVQDEIVIGFFTAVILGMASAIAVLWRRVMEVERDRDKRQRKDEDKSRDP